MGGGAAEAVKKGAASAAGAAGAVGEKAAALKEAAKEAAASERVAGAVAATKSAAGAASSGIGAAAGSIGAAAKRAGSAVGSGAKDLLTHPPLATAAGAAVGATAGAVGSVGSVGIVAGAAAGAAAAQAATAKFGTPQKEAPLEKTIEEVMDTNGAKAALAALESASLEAADRLKTAHGNLDEMARVEAEGVTLYLHKLAAEACAEPDAAAAPAAAAPDAAQNADPSAEKGPGVPRRWLVTALPASASAAYVASAGTAALLHGEVEAALGAHKRRLGSSRWT